MCRGGRTPLKLLRPRKLLGFRLGLENVGSNVALGERLPEFQPHERTGGVARRRTVIAFLEIGDHGEICVAHQWIEIEPVVTRDHGDRFADVPATPFDLSPDPIDVFYRPDLETLEVDEQNIAFGIVADAIGKVSAEQRVVQTHRSVAEDAWIHGPYIADQRFEIHLPENVAIKIDSGSDFDQLKPRRRPFEHTTLGDIKDDLAGLGGSITAESDLLYFFDELSRVPLAQNVHLLLFDRDFQPAAGESSGKHDLLGALRDVDEAAGTGKPLREPAHVDVSGCIGLCHA